MQDEERLENLGLQAQAEKARKDHLHLQQRAIEALKGLLARTLNEDLPVISWAIHSDPASEALTGTCDADDRDQRRRDFEAWSEALNATPLPAETTSQGVTTVRAAVTDNYLELRISLVADI
ncbi:hypothetical protein ACIBQ6_50370 [Nonomuraea sp. NPDC049655]|uniref:hypothetical protein n=1 Tax=Nonomuraea sp. NPDC049655 TaxID=3364355 RepID=UPI0037B68635